MKVLVAGGGIGGLSAALTLGCAGHDVVVFEQAAQFAEVGAGIQLSPNCTRVLHDLGLEDALRACAFLPVGSQFRHWRTGKVISESPLGESVVERYGYPYYHIHRADLMEVLIAAARDQPTIDLRSNATVGVFEQHDDHVVVMVNGVAEQGDVLIGADGIHSTVRAALWGDEQPTFTGNVAWRAMVPAESLPDGLIKPMSSVWWGPGKHFVHYYVRAGALVNCVCVVEKEGWEKESWTERGELTELRADFSGWHDSIQQLLAKADPESLFKWALFDRPPMSNWSVGRVTLLGDACHPTLPFMAQGAAMAIEDGAVLGRCLAVDEPLPARLKRYEKLRQARTAGVQRGSRRNATVFHLSGIKAWMRNRAARHAGGKTMDGLFRYDAHQAVKLTS